MVAVIALLADLFRVRKSPDRRFFSGRFITSIWTNRVGGEAVDRVSFRRPFFGGTINEFWHDELDDLSLAVSQAIDWIYDGIPPLDCPHLSQRGRRLHWEAIKPGTRRAATGRIPGLLYYVRPVRSKWTGQVRCKVTFQALYKEGNRGYTFPKSHLFALQCGVGDARRYVYAGKKLLDDGSGLVVPDLPGEKVMFGKH